MSQAIGALKVGNGTSVGPVPAARRRPSTPAARAPKSAASDGVSLPTIAVCAPGSGQGGVSLAGDTRCHDNLTPHQSLVEGLVESCIRKRLYGK